MSDDARTPTASLLFDELRDAEVISKDCYNEICSLLDPLFELAHSMDKSPDSADWDELRKEWSFHTAPGGVVPMNAANLCPKPTRITMLLNQLRLNYNNNVSQQERMGPGARRIQDARRAIAFHLGLPVDLDDPDADVEDLALVRNTSEANNVINNGYRNWQPGDNVVIWDQNHPTNKEAWYLRAQQYGFEVREVKLSTQATVDQITDAFKDKIDKGTRFLTFTETANSNGMRIPRKSIQDLWDVLNDEEDGFPECHLHIDGAMTWGAQHLDLLRNLPCHSFSASAHKWFCGPKETGILYMKPEFATRLQPSVFAYDYKIGIYPVDKLPKSARRFELLGQRDDVNIIHLLTEQEFLGAIGMKAIEARVQFLANDLKNKLRLAGFELVTPEESWKSHGIVRFHAVQGNRPSSLYDYLYENHRIAGSGDHNAFRLCPHIYNSLADINSAMNGILAWNRLPA